jgi:Flp pilus assembly protein TadG
MPVRIINLARRRTAFALNSEAGTTAVAFGMAVPVLMAGIGVAVDFGMVGAKQSRLQAAADQSAIAAVKELTIANTSKSSVQSAAESYTVSLVDDPKASIKITTEISPKRDAVTVTLKEEWTPFFAHFLGADMTPIVVDATAKLAGEANICVLALNSSSSKAIYMDKEARLQANGCGVYSNSKDEDGIKLDKNSELTAALICSAGGVKSRSKAVTPSPTTDCTPLPDPLASRAQPKPAACRAVNLELKGGTTTLDPGTYCVGIKISNSARVNFKPGEYIITDGAFEI